MTCMNKEYEVKNCTGAMTTVAGEGGNKNLVREFFLGGGTN